MGRIFYWASILACALSASTVLAQGYPSKPITLISPFAAGGTSDIVARALGASMSTQVGRPVIVVNRPGAGARSVSHLLQLRPQMAIRSL